jgi:hypothetical protein
MSPIWFVETYRGNGRPTGRVCEADHRYIPPFPEEGRDIGWWVGTDSDCYHAETDGIAALPDEVEEILKRW